MPGMLGRHDFSQLHKMWGRQKGEWDKIGTLLKSRPPLAGGIVRIKQHCVEKIDNSIRRNWCEEAGGATGMNEDGRKIFCLRIR
jgi:hypothetical protein